MSCFCVGGPNCCVNNSYTPDWTYRPTITPVQPLVTGPGTSVEIIPANPCAWNGHDFVESQTPGRLFCRRCGEKKDI